MLKERQLREDDAAELCASYELDPLFWKSSRLRSNYL
jgi:hypothetical protein